MINDYEEITGKIVNILAYQAVITAQGENYTGEKDWALNKLTELINQQLQKAREEERERIRKVVNDLLPIMWSDDAERHASNIRLTNNLNIILKAIDHSELDQDLSPIEIPVKGTQIDCKEHGANQIVIKDGAGWCGECLKKSELDQDNKYKIN